MSDGPHFNLAAQVNGLAPSATLAINERSARIAGKGVRVFRFGLGQSPFPVPPDVVQALADAAAEKDYLPVQGLYSLRGTIAAWHQRNYGHSFGPDDIIIGPGSKELIFLLQLVYDAELLLPSPSWVSYGPQAAILGRDVRWLPTHLQDGLRLKPDTLAAACAGERRPRLLILNYPNNPTGATYSAEDLAALGAVAREHGVLVLSDEIYGEVNHDGTHASIATAYPEGTIISSGLSKWCGAGGWRLGYLAAPDELRYLIDAMAAVASETFTSVSAPIQYAAIRAFEPSPKIELYLQKSRAILKALGGTIAQILSDAGAHVTAPEGGFYLFPAFSAHRARLAARGITTSPALCERLLEETGVATLPGTCFGRPASELSLRLSYVNFDGGAALGALEPGAIPDSGFLKRYCGDAVEAAERMAFWVTGPS